MIALDYLTVVLTLGLFCYFMADFFRGVRERRLREKTEEVVFEAQATQWVKDMFEKNGDEKAL